jgi:glycosyltransferase involved in cell wall biosynthesis
MSHAWGASERHPHAMRGHHITIDARLACTSGIGTYLQAIVPRVTERLTEARFTLLGDRDELRDVVAEGPRVQHRSFRAPIYSVREQVGLAWAIPRDTTMFWAPHYNIPLLHGALLAVMVHDVNHLVMPQSSALRRAYARVMFRAVARRARVVMCNSHFTAGEIGRVVRPRAPVVVTRLGVESGWLAVSPSSTPAERPYFLYVGNVKPHKNLPRLLAAFAQVAPAIPHRLVIVGEHEGFRSGDDEALRMAGRLGDRVMLTGHVSREALERWVRGCDALLLPSLYEGFGLPALEALACGRAVGVSRAGALPEVCGPEADYFDPLDVESIAASLRRLANAANGRDAQDRRRAWARQFDWDRCAAITVDALERAAAGPWLDVGNARRRGATFARVPVTERGD